MPVARRRVDANATAAPLNMEWTGWYRPRDGQWQPLVNGSTYEQLVREEEEKGRKARGKNGSKKSTE